MNDVTYFQDRGHGLETTELKKKRAPDMLVFDKGIYEHRQDRFLCYIHTPL